jgi:ubiquinone biosynthesis protein COQ9
MKITQEHLDQLRALVAPLDTAQNRKAYRSAGLSAMRYRWDLLWAAKAPRELWDAMYRYANDTHIDTALRRIVSDL